MKNLGEGVVIVNQFVLAPTAGAHTRRSYVCVSAFPRLLALADGTVPGTKRPAHIFGDANLRTLYPFLKVGIPDFDLQLGEGVQLASSFPIAPRVPFGGMK